MPTITHEELRAWQQGRGLNDGQAAALLHVHRITYSRWVNGHQKPPRWLHIVLEHADMLAQPEPTLAATGKRRRAKHNEWIVDYRDAAGQPMTVEQRKALPTGAVYWKSDADGTWSEWTKSQPGYSDIFTGVIRT